MSDEATVTVAVIADLERFRAQMQQAGREARSAFSKLSAPDMSGASKSMQKASEEVRRSAGAMADAVEGSAERASSAMMGIQAPQGLEAPEMGDIRIPDVEVPDLGAVEAPRVQGIEVPEVRMPELPPMPEGGMGFTAADFQVPEVSIPDIHVPDVEVPVADLPDMGTIEAPRMEPIEVPPIGMPETEAPKMGIEAPDMSAVKEAADGAMDSVGNGLGGAFKKATDEVGRLSSVFRGIPGPIGKAAGQIGKMGASLANAGALGRLAIGGVVGMIGGVLAKKIFDVSKQFGSMFDPVANEKATARLNLSIRKLKTSIGALLEPLYEIMTEVLGGIADGLTSVIKGLMTAVGYVQGLLGLHRSINQTVEATADAEEEAAESTLGTSSWDLLNNVDIGDQGDLATSQAISEAMADAYESGQAMRDSLGGFVTEFPARLRSGIAGAWDRVRAVGSDVLDALGDLGGRTWATMESAGASAWAVLTDTASSVASVMGAAWDALAGKASGIADAASSAWAGLTEAASSASSVLTASWDAASEVLARAASSASDVLASAWGTIGDTLRDAASSARGIIGDIASSVRDGLSGMGSEVWDGLGDVADTLEGRIAGNAELIRGFFQSYVVGPVKGALSGAWEGLGDIPGTIADTLGRVASALTDAVRRNVVAPVKSAVSGVWNGLTDGIRSALNALIDALNSVIRAYNDTIGRLSFDFELFGSHIKGGAQRIDTIPRLASGTVAEPNNPYLAIIGDNRREEEVVSPLSTIRRAVREAISEMAPRQTATEARVPAEITIKLDGKTLARTMYDDLMAETRRRGRVA